MRQMTRLLMAVWACVVTAMVVFGSPSVGYAGDSCSRIDSNPEWHNKIQAMGEAIKVEEWSYALSVARELEAICDRTPMLNYTTANIYKRMGNQERYQFYLQKAVDATQEYRVDRDLLNKIWSEKYIALHPEADPERIKELEDKVVKLESRSQFGGYEEHKRYGAGLWTGVAFAGAGVVLTTVGAVMAFSNDKPIEYRAKDDNPPKENTSGDSVLPKEYQGRVSLKTHAYTGMFIGGALMAVAGATVAGIMGYYYAKSKPVELDDKLSFQVAPDYVGMKLRF